uniref:Uncharacterized protein n=1 Tax=Arundo donax TaxID=35708 RepID=A0A0A8ZLA7_ARUDO
MLPECSIWVVTSFGLLYFIITFYLCLKSQVSLWWLMGDMVSVWIYKWRPMCLDI